MKGKANKCRKARGREWDKIIHKQHSRPSEVVTYHVQIDQLNIYLADNTNSVDLQPTHGKFVVYKPQRGRRRNK